MFIKRKTMFVSITLVLGLAQEQTHAQFDSILELSDLNGQNGFTINGVATGDLSGRSVSSAGDVNGDGIDDLIIGAPFAGPGTNSNAGSSYVVFGSDNPLPNPFNLSSLGGINGFTINGVASYDRSGHSVSAVGDVNGDGINDLMIGAYLADPNGNDRSGVSYVVFGSDSPIPNPLNLSNLDGSNGFAINGAAPGDRSGYSVNSAGDVNGDGIDDLIIGAYRADPNGNTNAGVSYVVFGSDSPLPNPLNLSGLDGQNGFTINGVVLDERSGHSVSSAGDFNGDGFDDLIISASGFYGLVGGNYVVFGSDSQLSNPLSLSSLDGTNGFVINGDQSSSSVSSAGDINGDGINDLIIGASGAAPNGNNFAGASYVVFGSDSPIPNPLNLSSLNGINGFTINGAAPSDLSGHSVSSAGDVNGDGIDDLIIGAFGATPNGISSAGTSYVVFGSDSPLPNPLNLSSLNGINGFAINGVATSDRAGYSVNSAGDVNNDGIGDMVIGADFADPNGVTDAGSAYVVFGNDVIFKDGFE